MVDKRKVWFAILILIILSIAIFCFSKTQIKTERWIQLQLSGETSHWRIEDYNYVQKNNQIDYGGGRIYPLDPIQNGRNLSISFYYSEASDQPFHISNPSLVDFDFSEEENYLNLGGGGYTGNHNNNSFNGKVFAKISWEDQEGFHTEDIILAP